MSSFPPHLPKALALVAESKGGPRFLNIDGEEVQTGNYSFKFEKHLLLAETYEKLLTSRTRKTAGAFYTPIDVAKKFAETVVHKGPVVDPSCGGGIFLLSAAKQLAALGDVPKDIVRNQIFGADIDEWAVAVCRWELAHWAGVDPEEITGVVIADPLIERPEDWPKHFGSIIGNPPFLSQMHTTTVRTTERREDLRSQYGNLVKAYTNEAWLFLALGLDLLEPGGQMALIQPLSLIAARDALEIREKILTEASLEGLWVDQSTVFVGRTEVCAPIIKNVTSDKKEVLRYVGREIEEATSGEYPSDPSNWGELVADLVGLPDVKIVSSGTVEHKALVTSGFRQHFYGLVPGVSEQKEETVVNPLITTAMVDPFHCLWGEKVVQFDGRKWERPVVDLEKVAEFDRAVGEWMRVRQNPKLFISTQTRVIEVVVDEKGDWIPLTPLLIVQPFEEDLWALATALSAPVISVLAARQALGAARSVSRITLSSKQLSELPLPSDKRAWEEAIGIAQTIHSSTNKDLEELWLLFGETINQAYGTRDDELISWWCSRHPAFRRKNKQNE